MSVCSPSCPHFSHSFYLQTFFLKILLTTLHFTETTIVQHTTISNWEHSPPMWSPSVPVFSPTRSILHIKSEIVVLDINKMALLPSHLLGLSSKSPFFKLFICLYWSSYSKPTTFKFFSLSPVFIPLNTLFKTGHFFVFIYLLVYFTLSSFHRI